MNKFRFLSAILLIAAVPVLMSCSKKSSSGEEDASETFQTINAKIYYGNSTLAPEFINMSVGGTVSLYVGNGSTKEIFGGPVKWTSTGSATLSLSAIQKTVGEAPLTKAGYDYGTSSATTNATTMLKINATADGLNSLKAADAFGNSKVVMVNVYPKD
ncbi:MAG: hypothetical protein IKX26_00340 [Bacteroidales bacterium]|nr:hypothetical protein [Bacteroidales bacterium]